MRRSRPPRAAWCVSWSRLQTPSGMLDVGGSHAFCPPPQTGRHSGSCCDGCHQEERQSPQRRCTRGASPHGSAADRFSPSPGFVGFIRVAASRSAPSAHLHSAARGRFVSRVLCVHEVEIRRRCVRGWRPQASPLTVAASEDDSLWQALVKITYRFYRANAKQQRWKNFYRDTPQMLPRPSNAGLSKATSELIDPNLLYSYSLTHSLSSSQSTYCAPRL
jgi:hypothetical protein